MGGIAVGVVLILTEGWPRLRHSLDFNALDGAVMAAEETDRGVAESRAKELDTSPVETPAN